MDTATYNRAIAEAGIDAPVYHIEQVEGGFAFHLPSRVITWHDLSPSLREGAGGGDSTPPTTHNPQPTTPADFTAIPYVGKEIATALHNAGYTTFDDLVRAPDTALLDVPHISAFTLSKIRKYLQEHYL